MPGSEATVDRTVKRWRWWPNTIIVGWRSTSKLRTFTMLATATSMVLISYALLDAGNERSRDHRLIARIATENVTLRELVASNRATIDYLNGRVRQLEDDYRERGIMPPPAPPLPTTTTAPRRRGASTTATTQRPSPSTTRPTTSTTNPCPTATVPANGMCVTVPE